MFADDFCHCYEVLILIHYNFVTVTVHCIVIPMFFALGHKRVVNFRFCSDIHTAPVAVR
jgi:hypothetical protein